MPLLAQIPDTAISALIQAGLLGPIVLWFMWRDGKERDRQMAREIKRDEQFERLHGTVADLVRVSGIDIMSRPNILERIKEETRELAEATEARRGK